MKLMNEIEGLLEASRWFLMNANALIKGKAEVAAIIKEMGDGILYQVTMDGSKKIYAYSSGSVGDIKVGDKIPYTQDTGQGHGKKGEVEVEGWAIIKGKKVAEEDNFSGEKRRLWVFK